MGSSKLETRRGGALKRHTEDIPSLTGETPSLTGDIPESDWTSKDKAGAISSGIKGTIDVGMGIAGGVQDRKLRERDELNSMDDIEQAKDGSAKDFQEAKADQALTLKELDEQIRQGNESFDVAQMSWDLERVMIDYNRRQETQDRSKETKANHTEVNDMMSDFYRNRG